LREDGFWLEIHFDIELSMQNRRKRQDRTDFCGWTEVKVSGDDAETHCVRASCVVVEAGVGRVHGPGAAVAPIAALTEREEENMDDACIQNDWVVHVHSRCAAGKTVGRSSNKEMQR
jgi:hypothetical protein